MSDARPGDVESVDAIVHALYDTISGPAGPRDWERLRSLFVEGGRLVPSGLRPTGEDGLDVMDVEAFVASASEFMAANSFYEREVARREERFGNIAHAWSTYESRAEASDPEPFMRGINSIQLVWAQDRWWVLTIFWDNETPDKPIPEQYLPRA